MSILTFEGYPLYLNRRRGQRTLRLSVKNGEIRLSGPALVTHSEMLEFLESKREWVLGILERHAHRKRELLHPHHGPFEPVLYLGEQKPIVIIANPNLPEDRVHVDIEGDQLVIRPHHWSPDWADSAQNREGIHDIVRRWLQAHARKQLTSRVEQLANEHGFRYTRLFIRSQTTKWGTCSSKKNLSLNWKLIQCPPHVIDYLIIHELCHLQEMNHSERFWALVASLYPDYKISEGWLKRYGSTIFQNYA